MYLNKKFLTKTSKISTNIYQFGVWPPRLLTCMFHNEAHPPVLANSIPKSGTNLLLRTLCLVGGYHRLLHRTFLERNAEEFLKLSKKSRSCKIFSGHIPYSEKVSEHINSSGLFNILIVRDPRDIALSNVHYIQNIDQSHRLNKYFSSNLQSFEQRLSASILGVSSDDLNGLDQSMDIGWHIKRYLRWVNDEKCLVIKFEDLIGEQGGGSTKKQIETVNKILKHIDQDVDPIEVNKMSQFIFNRGSRTFHKGVIGQWKEKYSSQNIKEIELVAGDCIDVLGYR
jgi:hypothetical protein